MRERANDPEFVAAHKARDALRYRCDKLDPAKLEAKRARMREYGNRSEVRAATKARGKKWIADNPERHRRSQTQWRRANPDKIRAYTLKWREKNRERWLAANVNRAGIYRWRTFNQGAAVFTVLHRRIVRSFWDDRCAYCGTALPPMRRGTRPIHFDHVVPLGHGGAHDPTNMVPACTQCNFRKNNRPLSDAAMAKLVPQIAALLDELPDEATYFGKVHLTSRQIEVCAQVADRIRGRGVPVGCEWD